MTYKVHGLQNCALKKDPLCHQHRNSYQKLPKNSARLSVYLKMPDTPPPDSPHSEVISGPRKRKAPPVDPDNSEIARLELISQNKKRRIAKMDARDVREAKSARKSTKEKVKQPVNVTKPIKNMTCRASVEDVDDVDDIRSRERAKLQVPKASTSKKAPRSANDSTEEESGEEATESAEAELSKNHLCLEEYRSTHFSNQHPPSFMSTAAVCMYLSVWQSRKHARLCFGEETVAGADLTKDIDVTRKISHRQHTKTEAKSVTVIMYLLFWFS